MPFRHCRMQYTVLNPGPLELPLYTTQHTYSVLLHHPLQPHNLALLPTQQRITRRLALVPAPYSVLHRPPYLHRVLPLAPVTWHLPPHMRLTLAALSPIIYHPCFRLDIAPSMLASCALGGRAFPR